MPGPGTHQRKGRGSPRQDRAADAAGRLLAAATEGPDAAGRCASEIAREVTGAARAKVITTLADAVRAGRQPLAAGSVERIVAELGLGGRSAPHPDVVHAAFRLALGSDPDVAARWVAESLRPPETGRPEARVRFPPELISDALRRSAGAGDLLVRTLRAVTAGEETGSALGHWVILFLRAIVPTQTTPPAAIEPAEAGACLDVLGQLRAEELPGDAFFLLPRLLALAPADAAASFTDSPAGRAVIAFIPVAAHQRPAPQAAVGDAERVAAEVRAGFERLAAEIAALQPTAGGAGAEAEALRSEMAALRAEHGRAAAARDVERTRAEAAVADLASVRSERDAAVERLRALEGRLAEAEASAERWRAESQRREGELAGQFQTKEGRTREEHRRLLAPATREVCDHIRGLLERNPGAEPIRRLGVSFDGLQRRVIQLIGETDLPRLPRQLLTPQDSEAGADGRAD